MLFLRRKLLGESVRRVVVKIGSRVLTSSDGRLDLSVLRDLVEELAWLHDQGKQVVVVTSGAVAAGRGRLGLNGRTLEVMQQQGCAAVGQCLLMEHYNAFFSRHGKTCGQLLLINDDFGCETRLGDLMNTFNCLLSHGVIPVVNENDAVSTSELDKSEGAERLFSDNDTLAALVACGINADALVILSGVDGLLGKDNSVVSVVDGGIAALAELDSGSVSGRGGLKTKLQAFERVTARGVAGVLANGRASNVVKRIFSGEEIGTLFCSDEKTGTVQHSNVHKMAERAREASRSLAKTSMEERSLVLKRMAACLEAGVKRITSANEADVAEANGKKISAAFVERLRLTEKGVAALANTLRKVASLDMPAETLASWQLDNGLHIEKKDVPLGVVCVIFESRPDVAVEATALTIKSGNAIILKGGREAVRTTGCIVSLLKEGAASAGFDAGCIQLFSGGKEELSELLKRDDCLDLVVARGGRSLMEYVRKNSLVPFLLGGEGNCHLYVHEDANIEMAVGVTLNAKVQKPSACNAIETLLVHKKLAAAFLPVAAKALIEKGVELRCCEKSYALLSGLGVKQANEADWATEFLDLVLAVKVVSNLEEAVTHINEFGTRHSEAIITESKQAAEKFMNDVDAAAIYWNASTRFTDGGQFGFGAELCISTQKLHARGPVGLHALSTYKYLVTGTGQVRR